MGHSDNRIFLRNAHVKKFRRGQGAPLFVEGGRLCHGTMALWPVQAWLGGLLMFSLSQVAASLNASSVTGRSIITV